MSSKPPKLSARECEAAGAQALVAVGVVGAAALGVGEDLVGLGGLLELLLGLGVVAVDVGMQLAGEPAEGLLDLGLVGAPGRRRAPRSSRAATRSLSPRRPSRRSGESSPAALAHRGDRGRVVHPQRADDADRAEVAVAEAVVGADDADRAQLRRRVLVADPEEDRALVERGAQHAQSTLTRRSSAPHQRRRRAGRSASVAPRRAAAPAPST